MKDLAKKYWISTLGGLFLFTSFIYFLKMAIDEGWLPAEGRAAIGFVAGTTILFTGYWFFKKANTIMAELISGLGLGILYATFAYAAFSEEISWSANTLFIAMVSLSSLVTFLGYKMNRRLLTFVSILGGLVTPVILKATVNQDVVLFIYVFVLNVCALYLSASKNWYELRIIAFLVTGINFLTYYVYFNPEFWGKPFFYVSSFFVVYVVGLIASSWYQKKRFDGLNLYLGIINAIHFVFWSIFIFKEFQRPSSVPLMLVGVLFVGVSGVVYRLNKSAMLSVSSYFFLGIAVIAIASGNLGTVLQTKGMHHVIAVGTWTLLCAMVYACGFYLKKATLQYVGAVGWSVLIVFWFSVAWSVEWVTWFGVPYIPFINPGGLVWISLALFGFVIAALNARNNKMDGHLSTVTALISHLVIGGLLTIQIQNCWEAYNIGMISVRLMLSISWITYAFFLFMWGAYSKTTVFRVLGSIVIVLTSVKIFAFDLNGKATFYKVGFLVVIGLMTLGIGYINRRWITQEEEPEEPAKEVDVQKIESN